MEKPPNEMPEPNGVLHMECRIIIKVFASEMEAKIGAQFTNFQTGEYLQTVLTENGAPKTIHISGSIKIRSIWING